MSAPKRVLMVAYHFPPLSGSSGIQRTLRFVQHLPAFGWQPIVLSADPRAYDRVSDDLIADIPASTPVRRAFALDTARHLSLGGRYLSALARPDRWVSWRFDGVRQGLQLIQKYKPQAIWSTYPIATAHLIGSTLARRSGLPWIADFRDPMAQQGYPADLQTWASYKRIEETAASQAALNVFATPGALREYQRRYPHAAQRMTLLENGYDEGSFVDVERSLLRSKPLNPGALTLLHSGIVYPAERDPEPLFKAVRSLLSSGQLAPGALRLRFRAAVHDALLQRLAKQYELGDVVETLPSVPYREALEEMLRADALLVLQSDDCNDQVPAKLYEYFRAGRPVLCLADPVGDTARACVDAGLPDVAALEDSEAIAQRLVVFVDRLAQGRAPTAKAETVRAASRQARCAQLAAWLDRLPAQSNSAR